MLFLMISIDVGIKNMAFIEAHIDGTRFVIDNHGKKEFKKKSINDLVKDIVDWCDEFDVTKHEIVLIENQRGVTMKAIQTCLMTYFTMKKIRTVGVSPKNKTPRSLTYQGRKSYTVDKVCSMCDPQNFAQMGKKPDDICDAIMQAIAWSIKNKKLTADYCVELPTRAGK